MDFINLKLFLQSELSSLFSTNYNTITLILDPETSPLLSITAGFSFLLNNGIKNVFLLETNNDELVLPKDTANVIYIILPKNRYIEQMCTQVNLHLDSCTTEERKNKTFSCYFIPRRNIIESYGLDGLITTSSLDFGLIPFEEDVASLELTEFIATTYLHNNKLSLARIAESMVSLQRIFGVFNSVSAKGGLSVMITKQMDRIARRDALYSQDKKESNMDILFIDRDLDLISPFMTQLTFEGLIDEVLTIKCGVVSLPRDTVIDDAPNSPRDKSNIKFSLNSTDELYEKVRDKPFGDALSQLADVTKFLKQQSDSSSIKGHSLSDLSLFVATLPNLLSLKKSVTIFIKIASMLTDYTGESTEFMKILKSESDLLNDERTFTRELLEELMLRYRSWDFVLRLIIIYSIANKGIKAPHFEFLKSEFVRTYGYDKLLILSNLEKMGWLCSDQNYALSSLKHFNYFKLKKSFNLINPFGSEQNPSDYSFVYSYSDYAPLSVRIVESFIRSGLNEIDQNIPNYPSSQNPPLKSKNGINPPSDRPLIVFYVGGITYGEIAALRFLSKKVKRRIMIATTCLINGKVLLNQLEFDSFGPDGKLPSLLLD